VRLRATVEVVWHDDTLQVEDALVRNLMVGLSICFPVAYVVLIAATGACASLPPV